MVPNSRPVGRERRASHRAAGSLSSTLSSTEGALEIKRSAGVLLYRTQAGGDPELLIVHMGGPFWKNKDAAGWSIPKGELEEGDEALAVARREFEEELGSPLPPVELVELGEITQAGGKRIIAFAGEADFDVADVHSNTFTIEWPPHSGRQQEFPEIDRAAWVSCDDARVKLIKGQVELIDRLLDLLRANGPDAGGERSSSPTLF